MVAFGPETVADLDTSYAAFGASARFDLDVIEVLIPQLGHVAKLRRGEFYFDQVKTLMDFAFAGPKGEVVHPCVGVQWFQYYDEPSLGRTDGERVNFGLLTVHDEPYQTALDVMRTLNVQLFDYLIDGKPLQLLEPPRPVSPPEAVAATQAVEVARLPRQSARPRFEWSAVDGAAAYTLLISPVKRHSSGVI